MKKIGKPNLLLVICIIGWVYGIFAIWNGFKTQEAEYQKFLEKQEKWDRKSEAASKAYYRKLRESAKSSSGSSSSSSGSSSSSSSKSSSGWSSYDAGYSAVDEDEEYDYDRYETDSDYANGVDDAMDDNGW